MQIQAFLTHLSLLFCLLLPALAGATGNISPTDNYAWSETAGWNNLAPTGSGVTVYPDHLEGFAWAENFGWIKLGTHTGGGAITYANSNATDWGVNLNGSNLSGFGWSDTAGWINFKPTGGGVTFDSASGALDGYAWAENLGWLHFKGSAPPYNVRLNALTLTVALAGNGGGSVHSTPVGISCGSTLSGGCSSSFFQSWPVMLGSAPDWKSLFSGYSGGSTTATFTMDTSKTVTASFDPNYKAKLLTANKDYASIQDAYDNAARVETIEAQAYFFQEPQGVVLGSVSDKTVALKGGYSDGSYSGTNGVTVVQGPVKIKNGRLTVERVTVR